MANGSRYYRALESVSIASVLSSALTIYPCQIRVHQRRQYNNFLQLGRRSGGWPQWTVYSRRLPVDTVIHTTLAGFEPTTFRLLVRRATSSATDSPNNNEVYVVTAVDSPKRRIVTSVLYAGDSDAESFGVFDYRQRRQDHRNGASQ